MGMYLRWRSERLRRRPDVGAVDVPVDHAAEDGATFALAYAEAGRDQAVATLVLLPGGPGLASVAPYHLVRRRLAAHRLHVVMPEHRGVGLSRHRPDGSLLPREVITMEQAARDVLAVVDSVAGRRVILAGTSYGGYLALEVAREAPERFQALVLDSTAASVLHPERDRQRACFWDGTEPGFEALAARVRALASAGVLTDDELATFVPAVFELAGWSAVDRLLARVAGGHTKTVRRLSRIGEREALGGRKPLVFDGDLVLPIWLGRIAPERPDGRPFDRSRAYEPARANYPDLPVDPFDATSWLAQLTMPTLVLQGARDMRVAPAASDELLSGLPVACRVTFAHAGHDLLRLRTRACAAIVGALARGGLAEAERTAAPLALVRPAWEPWAARLAGVVP